MSPYERGTWICLHPGIPETDAAGVPWWELHQMTMLMIHPSIYERLRWAGEDLTDAERLVAELLERAAGVMNLAEQEED